MSLHENQSELNEALSISAKNGNTANCEKLLDRGAEINWQNQWPLGAAAQYGHTETVRLLLKRGADPRARESGPLRDAAYEGHTEIVILLLDHGADIHAASDSALVDAASKNHKETMNVLLRRYSTRELGEALKNLEKDAEAWAEYSLNQFGEPRSKAAAQALRGEIKKRNLKEAKRLRGAETEIEP